MKSLYKKSLKIKECLMGKNCLEVSSGYINFAIDCSEQEIKIYSVSIDLYMNLWNIHIRNGIQKENS